MNTPRYSHRAALLGGYIYYVVGGSPDWSIYLDSVEFAHVNGDGSLSAWTYTRSLNTARHHIGVAFTDRYIYALGGRTVSGATASVEYTTVAE